MAYGMCFSSPHRLQLRTGEEASVACGNEGMMEGNGQHTMDGKAHVRHTVGRASLAPAVANTPVNTGIGERAGTRRTRSAEADMRPSDPRLV
jgi:hypothetical protein